MLSSTATNWPSVPIGKAVAPKDEPSPIAPRVKSKVNKSPSTLNPTPSPANERTSQYSKPLPLSPGKFSLLAVWPVLHVYAVPLYNAISPNGDGLNDIMIIRNIEMYPENELYIFNRWSQTIFETKNYGSNGNVFDGRHQKTSRILPVGTYFYLFTYKNKYGLIVKRKGYLYINN